ncbi:uncharacterized protein PFL1_05174 [Pseudozyma flocculosa PF-1]|uniref:Uncharacterized protein n=2 Tax=Pseudozyma flocculosa TaxID=84751 RepID=A0A5C3F657_9BASI|nr:uncharacterized protein PFL1_05174 [Pseudozyma flocculosa PF-1]EPQ27251.1 hypothetical protein PFL1_05174 [Pseudozyma flocculosa PF-1]SPO39620.1 related to OCA1 - putative protein tyrosine phosphatase [Pseudozyma flocculosa]
MTATSPSIPTAPVLQPPPLFAPVAPCIYRSATPPPSSHAFLSTLHLKTILSLTSELPSTSLQSYARKNGIRFIHFGPYSSSFPQASSASASAPFSLPAFASSSSLFNSTAATTTASPPTIAAPISSTITTETLKDSLQLLLDSSNHPILVTDTSGIQETGILLACLRKLQRWNFATILVEYRNFAGNRARAANERLIEMFDTDLITLPQQEDLPAWFAQQVAWDEDELDRRRMGEML